MENNPLRQHRATEYKKLTKGSSFNRCSAAPAEFCPGWVTATTAATEYLDGFWRAPIKRRGSDRNTAAAAEFGICGIVLPAAWTDNSARAGGTQRRCLPIRDWLKCRVAAPAAKLHSFSKTRLALRTHHDDQRRVTAMFAVKTSAA